MAGRGPQTFKKKQKEQQRKEKQQEKAAKRLERKQAKLNPTPEDDLLEDADRLDGELDLDRDAEPGVEASTDAKASE
jgi:hypothetical protein